MGDGADDAYRRGEEEVEEHGYPHSPDYTHAYTERPQPAVAVPFDVTLWCNPGEDGIPTIEEIKGALETLDGVQDAHVTQGRRP